MPVAQEPTFDKIAPDYDALWSNTAIGRAQRSAVWRHIDPLFKKGDFVLDLGCGTGVDGLHFQSRGVSVYAIDGSPQMVEVARRRGVDAHCFSIECLEHFDFQLDGVISNFGVLNCVESLAAITSTLAGMVRARGYVVLCFLNRFCLWEIAFYLLRGQPSKAFRRLSGRAKSSIGAMVFYPSAAQIVSAFRANFRLVNSYGIGFCVPPSYVGFLSERKIEQLSAADQKLAGSPAFRWLADHRLYVFQRL
jgi:SAM-dependent methyltransferase